MDFMGTMWVSPQQNKIQPFDYSVNLHTINPVCWLASNRWHHWKHIEFKAGVIVVGCWMCLFAQSHFCFHDFHNNVCSFHNVLPTICQPIEQENVKIPVPDLFQHALQEGKSRTQNKLPEAQTKQFLYSYSAVILKADVVLWPVQCSLHPGCGGGSGGGCPAADVTSAGTSGS